jgi:hypothetical protein
MWHASSGRTESTALAGNGYPGDGLLIHSGLTPNIKLFRGYVVGGSALQDGQWEFIVPLATDDFLRSHFHPAASNRLISHPP